MNPTCLKTILKRKLLEGNLQFVGDASCIVAAYLNVLKECVHLAISLFSEYFKQLLGGLPAPFTYYYGVAFLHRPLF